MTIELENRFPQCGQDYFYLHDLFKDEEIEWIKAYPAHLPYPEHFREIIWEPQTLNLRFSSFNQLENFQEALPKADINQKIATLSQNLIQSFAKKLNLQGEHQMIVQFIRYRPVSGETLTQSWHFDNAATYTMIAVLQNDFEEVNRGLDISFNKVEGPFNQKEVSTKDQAIPVNKQWKILSYPKNGGIIFHNQRGRLIHRMSTLAAKSFPLSHPLTRTIVQIKLLDQDWIDQINQ